MRAVMIASPEWLEDRRKTGADRWDEVWDGVLHVPPAPTAFHQRLESAIEAALRPLAIARGLEVFHQLAVLEPNDHARNYRIPDLVVVDPAEVISAGTEGPVELAIEILSPDDESRDKMPFYAARRVMELWLVDRETRAAEVYLLRGKTYVAVLADRAGVVRAPALDLELTVVAGPRLRIATATSADEV
jgi:Uma2 family endonuclease